MDRMETSQILELYKVIAVVGCSKDSSKYSNIVAKFMKEAGYRIIPVNPTATEVLGEKCYATLAEVPEKIEIVDVFRPSAEALEITKQAAAVGARVVWLQEGIMSDEAKKYAESKEILFVQDRCIMKEYANMK